MMNKILDWKEYESIVRQAIAEGNVLLKNDNQVLPLKSGSKISIFGRIQFHYFKSGTGSGGMVNVDKVTGIYDALNECDDVVINEKLADIYREWEKRHPYDEGVGWGQELWSQEEMPLADEMAREASTISETALVIIGRSAGEDKDNKDQPGAYQLTDIEEEMLSKVRKYFSEMVVILNVGNIMDMSFVEQFSPDAVLYAWQGGMVGGLGTADVLTGKVNPSGKLADTIALHIEDYPSNDNFGGMTENLYKEDIYVGYRYFETAAKEKVKYPFGFGLSYTSFQVKISDFICQDGLVKIRAKVKNTGKCSGKEVIQVYVEPPQGQLGKPYRNLVAFGKTQTLEPKEIGKMEFEIPYNTFASYDETGVTGVKSSYVLESGNYVFHVGNSVRNTNKAGSFCVEETLVLQKLSQALAPDVEFRRIKPFLDETGAVQMVEEDVPVRKIPVKQKRMENLPKEILFTGEKSYQLKDVENGTISMEQFIGQFTDEELTCFLRGEGMGSPKVTPGTAAAFGGVSDPLKAHGVPCGCCSDGPSGMRLDSGKKAFSLPNGTLLACTFNQELAEKLFTMTGLEMLENKVDVLLGPGMNIHRHPLNGRNFEYFSEDPFLTGKMAAAQLRGLHKAGVTGAIKHFCGNNQETSRHQVNSVISERALREIYLKGFEIAVKEGNADAVMTTYGQVNGIWTAGSYDLCTTILRQEWGFQGFVMTDWWAQINDEGEEPSKTNFAAMARAQNDVYMACPDGAVNSTGDNLLEALNAGVLTRGELQRNAANIAGFLLHTPAFERMNGKEIIVTIENCPSYEMEDTQEVIYYDLDDTLTIPLEDVETKKGTNYVFAIHARCSGGYKIELTAKSDLGELAQIPVTLFVQSIPIAVFTWNGTNGSWVTKDKKMFFLGKYGVFRLYFGQNGIKLKDIKFTFLEAPEDIKNMDEYTPG